jgi:hypothetical protein
MTSTMRKAVTAESVTFCQSLLVGAGCWSCVLPVALAVAPDDSLWAAAVDLRIKPDIMERILNYPTQSQFYHLHRMYVKLQVVSDVCQDHVLTRRVQQVIANCLWTLHPIAWSN